MLFRLQRYEIIMNYELRIMNYFVPLHPQCNKKIVQSIKFWCLRGCFLLVALATSLVCRAQDDNGDGAGDDSPITNLKKTDDQGLGDLGEFIAPFPISISDVIMLAALILVCYVFGKIWKGCTYLIILVAALLYYMTH